MSRWMGMIVVAVALLSGCTSSPQQSYDYTALRNARPASILVLPPVNQSTEVVAPYGVMAQIAKPIAEAGYYVFPVAVVNQTFMANGMTVAEDAQAIPPLKLHEIFGADAGMYITITDYGTTYAVLASDTVVSIEARLIDLRSGQLLWQGAASASSGENRGNSGGGMLGMLVEAAITQIIETVSDRGFDVAAIATGRLLSPTARDGLLPGPRSPQYQLMPQTEAHSATPISGQ
ncbi:DUF799 domain-containing protein [Alteromonas gilva]|uniref:DUF799 domain-containing protein n=1 Tax=Alteromonas gilva TaxID=2987522 RepID=A0ABT5KZA7_9ALTE|nr:DUF799 domain-containing protein [Alteromonas gilva]MDC8829524.1 DUF799 domain-containing protein [Alteromonas gilva]